MTDLMPLLRRLTGDEKHAPSAFSTLDVLWVLYDRILDVSPQRARDPERDRFLLSTGHGPAAYYAVLAAKGFIPDAWLDDLAGPDSPLGHHPDRFGLRQVLLAREERPHGELARSRRSRPGRKQIGDESFDKWGRTDRVQFRDVLPGVRPRACEEVKSSG